MGQRCLGMAQTSNRKRGSDVLRSVADLERELVTIQRELEHAQRLAIIGTLAAGIAHEVNNLLTPALGYAQLALESDNTDGEISRAVSKTVDGVKAASEILQTMLEFASPEEGAETVADVHQGLSGALACLGKDLARDRIGLVNRVPPGTRVAIDPLGLQQVLLNLLLNARRALVTCGGGEIRVAAEALADGRTRISIADDGPGIPPESTDSIFKPFVSLAPESGGADRDGTRGGSGLGLSVCRRTVHMAGGTMSVEETPGGGATFLIVLPTGPPAESARAG